MVVWVLLISGLCLNLCFGVVNCECLELVGRVGLRWGVVD